MENVTGNIFSKIFNKVKRAWARLGEPDIDNVENLTPEEEEELAKIQEISDPDIKRKLNSIQARYNARVDEIEAQREAGKRKKT